jgi:type I restriction-modification system DNA methylase subunit
MKPSLDTNHRNELVKLLKQAAYSRDVYQVFNDFLEMSAIAISNTVDYIHKDERESQYLEIIRSYEKREQELFPEMYARLVLALEEKANSTGPEDVLGAVFNELELRNKNKGQVFTPQHIADFMASISCQDDVKRTVEEKGFVSMCDPCCGAGVFLMSMAKAMTENGLNYHTQLICTATDIDTKCVHMTYLQCVTVRRSPPPVFVGSPARSAGR